MKIDINNKYNIGNIVQRYIEHTVFDKEVECPICHGEWQAYNPAYNGDDGEEDEVLECGCCNRGKIRVGSRVERVLEKEKYRVSRIYVSIDKECTEVTYSLDSTPELNGRTSVYFSCSASEDELSLVRRC